eukprot:6940215-Prymnesium_polylepis.1
MELPKLKTVNHDFLGLSSPHVRLAGGRVDVVLEEVFRSFCGIVNASNQNRRLRDIFTEIGI